MEAITVKDLKAQLAECEDNDKVFVRVDKGGFAVIVVYAPATRKVMPITSFVVEDTE